MLYLHRYAFALIKPKLADEWGLSEKQMGAMDSAFNLGYALFQVPSGLVADFLGMHFFLTGLIVAWSMALALHAVTPNANAMYWVRFGFGATQAGCYPVLSKVTRAWFPDRIRTSLQGLIASFFGRMGGASSNLLLATLLIGVLGVSWRGAVVTLAMAGIGLGLVFLVWFRNSPAVHPHVNAAELALIAGRDATPMRSDLPREALSHGNLSSDGSPRIGPVRLRPRGAVNLACFLGQQFCCTFADAIYVSWVPYFLSKEHGLNFKEMGFYSALPLIGGALGGLVGGWLNDRLLSRMANRRWARSGVGMTGNTIAATLVLTALTAYDNPYAFCWLLFAVKLFSDWNQPTVWGTITDIGRRQSGTVFGLLNTAGTFGGLVSPFLFGWIAQEYSWNVVFFTVAGAYAVTASAWLLVDCREPVFEDVTGTDAV